MLKSYLKKLEVHKGIIRNTDELYISGWQSGVDKIESILLAIKEDKPDTEIELPFNVAKLDYTTDKLTRVGYYVNKKTVDDVLQITGVDTLLKVYIKDIDLNSYKNAYTYGMRDCFVKYIEITNNVDIA